MNLSVSQRCEFVKNTPDCTSDQGFINYPWMTFCLFSPQLLPLVITLYVRTISLTTLLTLNCSAHNWAAFWCVSGEQDIFVYIFYIKASGFNITSHLVTLTFSFLHFLFSHQVLWLLILFLVLGLIASDLWVCEDALKVIWYTVYSVFWVWVGLFIVSHCIPFALYILSLQCKIASLQRKCIKKLLFLFFSSSSTTWPRASWALR